MADTAGPQTPTKKLFKASTKTPPVRKHYNLTKTPQSAQSSIKSASPSPVLFGRSSKTTTPRLVRKASSHTPASPSKFSSDDIVQSTPLAPLTSKLDVDDGRIPEYAASDTTGDTPIGLIDNDVLTPTDTVSRSTDAPKALSRESSETMIGAAGGSPTQVSTQPGYLDEKAETVTNAPEQATEPEDAPEQAYEQSAQTSQEPVSGETEDQRSDAAESTVESSEPIDLAQYFLDAGNPEMSKFIKALIGQDEDDDSVSEPTGALSSIKDSVKDNTQNADENLRDTADDSTAKLEDQPEEHSAKRGSPKRSEAPPAQDSSEDPSEENNFENKFENEPYQQPEKPKEEDESTNQEEKPLTKDSSKDPIEISAKDDDSPLQKPEVDDDTLARTQKSSTQSDPQSGTTLKAVDVAQPKPDAGETIDDSVNTFYNDPKNLLEELPTSDDLVALPSSQPAGTTKESQSSSNSADETATGFPGVSTNPVEELPNDDDLVSLTVPDSEVAKKQSQSGDKFKADAKESSPESAAKNPLQNPQHTRKSKNATTDSQLLTTKASETFGRFPNDLAKELPTDESLVVEPGEKAKRPFEHVKKSTEETQKTVSGFPDVSQNIAEELPSIDGLVSDTTDKVQANTESLRPASAEPQQKTQSTKEQLPAPGVVDTSKPIKSSITDKVGIPDTRSITEGKDVGGDTPGKALDLEDTISDPRDESGKEKDSKDDLVKNLAQRGLEAPDLPNQASDRDVVSTATQKPSTLEEVASLTHGAPDTSNLSQKTEEQPANGYAKSAMTGAENDAGAKAPQQPKESNNTPQPKGPASGIQAQADNMGKPAQMNRRIDIPLPRPERPTRPKSRMDMPEVDDLKSTDDLNNVNDLDDPPEEFLDPSVHTPPQRSANISPVPRIHGISPITSQPPPDLARLANGLGGYSVDDVGNVVDESGKVLGHATGDLPSMIGQKVADNGEIYGDKGELIGFVTENFTGHPPPPTESSSTPQETTKESSKETPLPSGLKVDGDGNILDGDGNIVGKLNRPSGSSIKALTPYAGEAKEEPKTQTDGEKENPNGEKPREKFDEGAIPADIFLDVKSTPDGIQLTIRIPTVFKQETRPRQEPPQEHPQEPPQEPSQGTA